MSTLIKPCSKVSWSLLFSLYEAYFIGVAAAHNGATDLIKFINMGVNVNIQDEYDRTLLYIGGLLKAFNQRSSILF